jgi:capsular exopolysaccharide synthesis family protein
MNLRDHFQIIWRRKWQISAVAVVVAVAVYAWFGAQSKVYQGQAQLSVTPGQVSSGVGASQSDAVFLAATYAQLANTAPVVQAAATAAHLPLSEAEASGRLSVSASTTVGFITVTATGPSPAAATALAQGEADALTAAVTAQQEAALASQLKKVNTQIDAITSRLAATPAGSSAQAGLQAQLQALEQIATNQQSQPLDEINVVAPARSTGGAISPKPTRDALLGLLTALVVGSELAVLLEVLSDRFPADRLEDEVTKATGLAVLAHVPAGNDGDVIEAFRKIRTALLFMGEAERIRTVAVVSTEPGVGKSFVSIHLAFAVAEIGASVVIVDGDMRRPAIHERLGVPRSPGLSEVLFGADPRVALHPLPDHPGLLAMPAGQPVADPPGLLAGSLARRVLIPLATTGPANTELLVVDSPPEGLFSDALTIAAQCDAAIVVVDARGGRRRSLRRTLDQLRQVGAKPLGIVLNRSSRGAASGYDYGAYGKPRQSRWSVRRPAPAGRES